MVIFILYKCIVEIYSLFVYESFSSIEISVLSHVLSVIYCTFHRISSLPHGQCVLVCHCLYCVPFLLLVPVCFRAELARGMIAACSPMPSSIHPSLSLYYQILIGFFSYYSEIRGLSVDFHFPLCCDNTSHHTHLVPATFH